MTERIEMGADEIADMDIVADAGAIGRGIVGAEHFEIGPLAERRLHRNLDEVGRVRGRLPAPPLRVGAGDIEPAFPR
jgi:hypothetical protein